MTKFMPFYYDERGFYQNDKSFMITGTHVSYLADFLNSSLFKFCFRDYFPELLGGTRELRKIFFDKIPVKKVSDSVNDTFESGKTKCARFEKRNVQKSGKTKRSKKFAHTTL